MMLMVENNTTSYTLNVNLNKHQYVYDYFVYIIGLVKNNTFDFINKNVENIVITRQVLDGILHDAPSNLLREAARAHLRTAWTPRKSRTSVQIRARNGIYFKAVNYFQCHSTRLFPFP